jgi:hypothetical protein
LLLEVFVEKGAGHLDSKNVVVELKRNNGLKPGFKAYWG